MKVLWVSPQTLSASKSCTPRPYRIAAAWLKYCPDLPLLSDVSRGWGMRGSFYHCFHNRMEKRQEKQGQVVPAASLPFWASKEVENRVFVAAIDVHFVGCEPGKRNIQQPWIHWILSRFTQSLCHPSPGMWLSSSETLDSGDSTGILQRSWSYLAVTSVVTKAPRDVFHISPNAREWK